MNKLILAAASLCAIVGFAPSANATVSFSFDPGLASPSAGFTVVNRFDNANGLVGSGYQILLPPANGNGAPPANSFPSGTSYLSVLGNGYVTYTFAAPVAAFQFDWGSIDTYNTLVVGGSNPITIIPGVNFHNPANGNQAWSQTNGRFTVFGTAGETFTSVTFRSSTNSFEVDNLAVRAVPEPTTWAMMLLGVGMIGFALRGRRKQVGSRIPA